MSTIAETMRAIRQDCYADIKAMDGQPFNGRTVAEAFGNTLAMLSTVAKGVELLAERIDSREQAIADAFTPPDPFSRKV